MTIRTKLFIFIPLLVILANSVAYFVFQSGKIVQRSYDEMMGRVLLLEQTSESADSNLKTLYAFLLDPGDGTTAKLNSAEQQLTSLGVKISELPGRRDPGQAFTKADYSNLLAALLEQKQSVVSAAESGDMQAAFAHYVEAETTVGYIREEEQQLVDAELAYYGPIIDEIRNENRRMNSLGLALFGMNAFMGILLAFWISRSVTGPVGGLVAMAQKFAKGKLDMEDPEDTKPESDPVPKRLFEPQSKKDEFGILSHAMRQMASDLSVLIEKDKQSLEMKRVVKELELQSLQSQIQPHFLFNTLNVLSKLALLEGAEKTSDLIVSMSNLLRYNLQQLDKPVTLREEVAHIKEYVTIQQARFRDRIAFEFTVDEAALTAPIPALTLQPLVENAFLHGVSGMESGACISLRIRKEESEIHIELKDNGAGMPNATREALLRLETPTEGKRSTGLGTRNVFRRLQLFYGREDLVEIYSEPGKGTIFHIRIPASMKGGTSHVPTSDRG